VSSTLVDEDVEYSTTTYLLALQGRCPGHHRRQAAWVAQFKECGLIAGVDDGHRHRDEHSQRQLAALEALARPDQPLCRPIHVLRRTGPGQEGHGRPRAERMVAGSEEHPLMFFAGFLTPWRGIRKVRDGEREYELFGFLTTEPNEIVSPIYQKAMPTILPTP
jgi:hypothetical protein